MDTPDHVVVTGNGLPARLLVLHLHKAGLRTTWLRGSAASMPPAPDIDMMPMGGDDLLPMLMHQSISAWRAFAADFEVPGLLRVGEVQDIANSAGRVAMLRHEALLDAASGENISYVSTPPAFADAAHVKGAKVWREATLLAADFEAQVQGLLDKAGLAGTAADAAGIDVADPLRPRISLGNGEVLEASHVVLTGPAATAPLLKRMGLVLPLRPARGHVLRLVCKAAHGLPLVIHRLKRGHMFVIPQDDTTVVLHYNAIADPSQATYGRRPSPELVKALQQHAAELIPALRGATLERVDTVTHWLTPDYLPALGLWPGLDKIVVGMGFAGRDNGYAAGSARILMDILTQGKNPMGMNAIAPNRFAGGAWKAVEGPGSLMWDNAQILAVDVAMAGGAEASYMDKVTMVDPPAPRYASTVNQVEKTIMGGHKTMQVEQTRPGKSKIVMAPVKPSDT